MRTIVAIGITCAILHISMAYASDVVRNKRYCEIILSKAKMQLQVLNTWGLNDCPTSHWKSLSERSLKHETGSFFVQLRGPQYYVMDKIEQLNVVESQILTLGQLSLRIIAWVEVRPSDIIHGSSPYHEHQIHRQISYTYAANQPVFELIDPQGHVFVMQSYSVQKINQTLADLSFLNQHLRLPKNWKFKSGVLKNTKKLVGGNHTIMLHDDYLNSYQLAPDDFLD